MDGLNESQAFTVCPLYAKSPVVKKLLVHFTCCIVIKGQNYLRYYRRVDRPQEPSQPPLLVFLSKPNKQYLPSNRPLL